MRTSRGFPCIELPDGCRQAFSSLPTKHQCHQMCQETGIRDVAPALPSGHQYLYDIRLVARTFQTANPVNSLSMEHLLVSIPNLTG